VSGGLDRDQFTDLGGARECDHPDPQVAEKTKQLPAANASATFFIATFLSFQPQTQTWRT
jgi:hypothetical protein